MSQSSLVEKNLLDEMKKIRLGNVVQILVEEGHEHFSYLLKVEEVEPYEEGGEIIEIIAYRKV